MPDEGLSPGERLRVLEDGEVVEPTVVRDGEAILADIDIPNHSMELIATDIRRSRWGLKAQLRMTNSRNTLLGYDLVTVDKDEDRRKFAKSVAERIGDKSQWQPIKTRLDLVCAQMWDRWCSGDEAWWTQPKPRQPGAFLVPPFVRARGGSILFGHGGAGKSWMGLLWALSLHHDVGPWKRNPAKTLFVNLERDEEEIQPRVHEGCKAFGIKPQPMLAIHRMGASLERVFPPLKRSVERHDVGLVVVDSLSRTGAGDLKDDQPANNVSDMLNSLGCAWLALGHTSWEKDSHHVFGSVHWTNAAGLSVEIESQAGPKESKHLLIGCKLTVRKINDGFPGPPQIWVLVFGRGTGTDPGPLLDVRPAHEGEFLDLESGTLTLEERIIEYLLTEGPSPTPKIARELDENGDSVSKTCRRSRRIDKAGQGGGHGKAALWIADP